MRIVHIITRLIVGGAQENTLISCEGQHRRGHEVTLVTGPAIGPEGSLMERAAAGGGRGGGGDQMRRGVVPGGGLLNYRWLVERGGGDAPGMGNKQLRKAGV